MARTVDGRGSPAGERHGALHAPRRLGTIVEAGRATSFAWNSRSLRARARFSSLVLAARHETAVQKGFSHVSNEAGTVFDRPKSYDASPSVERHCHVQCRSCLERGNCARRTQRDSSRNRDSEEGFRSLPIRNRSPEAASARVGTSAPGSEQGRSQLLSCCSKRGVRRQARQVQCKKHGGATPPTWTVGSRVRFADRRVGAVDLQLGRGQDPTARPAPARHLRAQESRPPPSKRDRGDSPGRLGHCRRGSRQARVRTGHTGRRSARPPPPGAARRRHRC